MYYCVYNYLFSPMIFYIPAYEIFIGNFYKFEYEIFTCIFTKSLV